VRAFDKYFFQKEQKAISEI